MKCPYRVNIEHAPEKRESQFALYRGQSEIVWFGECYKEECPFWDVDIDGVTKCRRAWAEVWQND